LSSRKEQREQARAEREAREAAERARAQRNRRMMQLGGALVAAAAIVVVLIVVSRGGSAKGDAAGATQSSQLLTGIPQQGVTLGNPKAPVTLTEFADLQCPFCRDYTVNTFPSLVAKYVRTGKVKMVFQNYAFIGPDSLTAARAAEAAGKQNKLWNFIDVFYYNQGEENTGYVTPSFLHSIDKAAGVDSAKSDAFAASSASVSPIEQANALGDQLHVQSTPTVFVGKRGGALQQVQAGPTDVDAFKKAIDGVLGQA
jgi:protein-disulfide isomerase